MYPSGWDIQNIKWKSLVSVVCDSHPTPSSRVDITSFGDRVIADVICSMVRVRKMGSHGGAWARHPKCLVLVRRITCRQIPVHTHVSVKAEIIVSMNHKTPKIFSKCSGRGTEHILSRGSQEEAALPTFQLQSCEAGWCCLATQCGRTAEQGECPWQLYEDFLLQPTQFLPVCSEKIPLDATTVCCPGPLSVIKHRGLGHCSFWSDGPGKYVFQEQSGPARFFSTEN